MNKENLKEDRTSKREKRKEDNRWIGTNNNTDRG